MTPCPLFIFLAVVVSRQGLALYLRLPWDSLWSAHSFLKTRIADMSLQAWMIPYLNIRKILILTEIKDDFRNIWDEWKMNIHARLWKGFQRSDTWSLAPQRKIKMIAFILMYIEANKIPLWYSQVKKWLENSNRCSILI